MFLVDVYKRQELKSFAEDDIEPRLERQEGVTSVDIMGGTEQEILIEIDPKRLEGLGLTMTSIGQILSAENSNQSGGSISYGEKSMTISTKQLMESIEDVKNTPIQIANGTVMRLGDIATIPETQKEVTSISRYNGESRVTLSVTQSSDCLLYTSGQFDWGGRLLKGNGGARRSPQNDWKPFKECKGKRWLDCDTDGWSRYESRT